MTHKAPRVIGLLRQFFPKGTSFATFPMMIYSILLISSIIVPVNVLFFVLTSRCFVNFFVDFVALDLIIYHHTYYFLKGSV